MFDIAREAHELVQEIEVSLAEQVYLHLTEMYGRDWPTRVPPDVGAIVEKARTARPDLPLEEAFDLSHLIKIAKKDQTLSDELYTLGASRRRRQSKSGVA